MTAAVDFIVRHPLLVLLGGWAVAGLGGLVLLLAAEDTLPDDGGDLPAVLGRAA